MVNYIDAEHFDARVREAMGMAMDDLPMGYPDPVQAVLEMLKTEPSVYVPQWIPIKTRPMTSEERNDWEEKTGFKLADEDAVFFDCQMPDDEEEILICSKYGRVSVDECVFDEYGIALDVNGDWDGIVAWMPLPTPYKGGEEE